MTVVIGILLPLLLFYCNHDLFSLLLLMILQHTSSYFTMSMLFLSISTVSFYFLVRCLLPLSTCLTNVSSVCFYDKFQASLCDSHFVTPSVIHANVKCQQRQKQNRWAVPHRSLMTFFAVTSSTPTAFLPVGRPSHLPLYSNHGTTTRHCEAQSR